ncbi:MAG TPA: molybdate ABC transporter substrate-binding protein [Cyanobacteria bacterium UBA11149]|nr:molybdate ABC transporter substrate-binding protein [Cyanobacteria bacterium UBA11367]HBE60110.1 molybdate ABC transporter substrate-binding protein [Cyanobacteria bacterium UBA11366]HBK62686.1 molybdate ABC transporter substrate-binding protein [Cyanobacteria bacterium UBA11166]HBR73205.1 molybdate ABC transporter substrate-binding protein [Cyanobacteria bacterium UBA11159]HBS71640.1 molybdate ABC transporter substrate-binding protein [Cyanobacteria bacterium UBA11153]HBW90816.1 molybdate 
MERRRFIGLSLLAFLAACSTNTNKSQSPQTVTITVSAAASLQNVMEEIQQLYRKENPNVTIIYNFASSGSLQQQIEQGAPVDIFMSAASKQMNTLANKDLLLTDTRQDIIKNEVVLIVPKDAKGIGNFKDLSSDIVKKIAIGDPESVPVGQYSKEVFTSLKLSDKIKPKLIFAKDVRQVLYYVETGNVDAGIVYKTDAKLSDKIEVVATALPAYHAPIVYPVAVLKDSKNPDVAKKFVQFLSSDTAKQVFEKYGFIPN